MKITFSFIVCTTLHWVISNLMKRLSVGIDEKFKIQCIVHKTSKIGARSTCKCTCVSIDATTEPHFDRGLVSSKKNFNVNTVSSLGRIYVRWVGRVPMGQKSFLNLPPLVGLPEQAMGWLPLRFGIGRLSRR